MNAFLEHIVASTNMKCLTPPSALEGDCGFLAANLYAKSVFGGARVPLFVETMGFLSCAAAPHAQVLGRSMPHRISVSS